MAKKNTAKNADVNEAQTQNDSVAETQAEQQPETDSVAETVEASEPLITLDDAERNGLDDALHVVRETVDGTLTLDLVQALTAADAANHASEIDENDIDDLLTALGEPQASVVKAAQSVNAIREALATIEQVGRRVLGEAEHRRAAIVAHVNQYELELKRLLEIKKAKRHAQRTNNGGV